MDSEAKDMKGNAIFVGCKVSDGMIAGEVTSIERDKVWFVAEGSIGKPVRGHLFARPEDLLVISPEVWKRCMTNKQPWDR